MTKNYTADRTFQRLVFLIVALAAAACAAPPDPPIPSRTFQTEFTDRKIEVFDGEKKTCLLSLYDDDGDAPGYDCFKRLPGEQTNSTGVCAFDHNLSDDGDELQVRWIGRVDSGSSISFPESVIVQIKSAGKLYGDESEVRDVGGAKYVAKGNDIIRSQSGLTSCE